MEAGTTGGSAEVEARGRPRVKDGEVAGRLLAIGEEKKVVEAAAEVELKPLAEEAVLPRPAVVRRKRRGAKDMG